MLKAIIFTSYRIDTTTLTDEIFALLDNVNSDSEDNNAELLNDSDT